MTLQIKRTTNAPGSSLNTISPISPPSGARAERNEQPGPATDLNELRAPDRCGDFSSMPVNGSDAVRARMVVGGKKLDALLCDGSFDKTREEQVTDAAFLGYRLATRQEHEAFAQRFIEEGSKDVIPPPVATAGVHYYSRGGVRDAEGRIEVSNGRYEGLDLTWLNDIAGMSALYVRERKE